MVNRNLLRQFEPPEDQLRQELDAAFAQGGGAEWLPAEGQDFREHRVVTGRVLHVSPEGVWVDVGYESRPRGRTSASTGCRPSPPRRAPRQSRAS